MTIHYSGTTDPPGLEIYDPIEQRRLHVKTPEPVSLEAADTDEFCFPVDAACAITTESLVLNQRYSVDVHDEQGQVEQNVETTDAQTLDPDTNFVGLTGPIKLYCRIESTGRIETGIDSVHMTFETPTTVVIGARSLHEEPAGTITTPDDPETMMEAVSALSSALKTTSPERTWPTLRGHPPLIHRGESLEIPDLIDPPTTDVTITVPPTYRDLYVATPLAFYLGATIEPGAEPILETRNETIDLDGTKSFVDTVARTLQHVFTLDCIVRTEGLYRYDLHERNELEATIPFDLADAYDASLSTRLEYYFEVPHDVVEPFVPRWPLTAHVPASAAGVEILPFVVNELGIIRDTSTDLSRNPQDLQEHVVSTADPSGFTRLSGQRLELPSTTTSARPRVDANVGHDTVHESQPEQFVRSTRTTRSVAETADPVEPVVEPPVDDESIEHAWFGTGIPIGASKATIKAYHNQLSRGPRNKHIEILLVCNDARMLDEHDVLDDTYGTRDTLPFDVDSEFGVRREELATLLQQGSYDFLHYIGHATSTGLECPDGELDVRELRSVDVGVFFLNACDSYEQGVALIEQGAYGGVATIGDVVNEHAVEVGQKMAYLLNHGFPLRASLELVEESNPLGGQYLVVGDGSTDIAQSDGGPPGVDIIESIEDDCRRYSARFYNTKEFKLGTTTLPTFRKTDQHYLIPGTSREEFVSSGDLDEYLIWTSGPVITDGRLEWNDGIGFDPFG